MLKGTLTSGVKITASINSSNSPGGTTYGEGVNGVVQGGVRKLYIGYSKEEIDAKLNTKQNNLTSAQLETINADHSKYLTEHQDIGGKQDVINDLANIRSGASLGATALQSYTETDPVYIADKPSLALKSELFSKNYNDLTNKPTIPSISGLASESYVTNAIKDKADKSEIITSYNDLSDKPSLFDGNYNSLTNKPTLVTSYNQLTDKPTIPTVPTNVSAFTNDAGYLTKHQDISGKVDKAGDTVTGRLSFTHTDPPIVHTNGKSVSFGVGSGKVNRGIWDNSNNRWMIYTNTDVYPMLSQSPPSADNTLRIATTGFVKAQGYLTSSGASTAGFLKKTDLYEADLKWGGKNYSASYGCIDSAMIPALSANRFAFLKKEGIAVEYTRDGGQTWIDYEATDAQKIGLFTDVGTDLYLGKADSTNKATANEDNYQLRITVTSNLAGLYTMLNKFAIYVSTNGSTNCTCTILGRLKSDEDAGEDTWATFSDTVSIAGWSGWNIINIPDKLLYGNPDSKKPQYSNIRFVFKANGGNANYIGLRVLKIFAYGGVGWDTPSNLAGKGTIYTYDVNQNVIFPAQVTATKFNGKATSASSADSVAWGNVSGKPSFFSGNYNDLTNKPTIPTVPTNISSFTNDSGYITEDYHDSTKQDVISNLSTIESNASAGKSASDTISGYGNIVTHNASEFLTEHQDISGKQDKLTAGDNITITNNVISASGGGGTTDSNIIVLTDDNVTVTTDSTKGVAPYSTSYGYTNITANLSADLLKEGTVISIVVNTKMVVASAYRNVRIRFGESGAYHPVMNASTTILTGSTYFVKAQTRLYVYSTRHQNIGAFHMLNDDNSNTYDRTYDNYYRPYAGSQITSYKMCMRGIDNRLYPLTTTSGTGTNKDVQTAGLRPDKLWYYASTTTTNAGGVTPSSVLYRSYPTSSAHYTFNETLPTYCDVYLCGDYDTTTGLFYLATTDGANNSVGNASVTSFYTFVPTNSATVTYTDYFKAGRYYIHIGGSSTSANYLQLFDEHELMKFDGTNLTPCAYAPSEVGSVSWDNVTGKPSFFSGDYDDLTNKPTLFDGNYNSLTNKPTLFSGSYNDLTNKPTIPTVPTNVSAFTNDAGYLTSHQSLAGYVPTTRTINSKALSSNITLSASDVGALSSSYTSLDATKLSGTIPASCYTDTKYTHPSTHPATMITGLSTVATSGSYNDLSDKPTIPSEYTLPIASDSTLGGIKVGDNLSIDENGVLSATSSGGDYLPLSGGTITGNLELPSMTFSNNSQIRQAGATSHTTITLFGIKDNHNGCVLALADGDNVDNCFILRAGDGVSTVTELKGFPNGTLTWNDGVINPAGMVIYVAQSTAPDGFLVCNGSNVSRTTYAKLFAAIGTTYGNGDGSTTFTLPDLRDRFIQGNTTVGGYVNAGLPNITGRMLGRNGGTYSDAFYGDSSNKVNAFSGTASNDSTVFDASRCSSIYGNSTTVQPPALKLLPCIKY